MMLTSRSNTLNATRLPLPTIGGVSRQQRPTTNTSVESIDNAYSLEHLFVALRRRLERITEVYSPSTFYYALKTCARLFQSYASLNLNIIDQFAHRLHKTSRTNKRLLTLIDQFRLQLAELRHCHSTFEAELLVTVLALDFHESEEQQQTTLPVATGKFSPRSRMSKLHTQHVRHAIELKNQLRKTNEHLQILLNDEFAANVGLLWEGSERILLASLQFHDPHMTYILRLIPDIALKFEYALHLCSKLFDLDASTSGENVVPQKNKNSNATPVVMMMMTLTPRTDVQQQQQQQQQEQQQQQYQQQQKQQQQQQQQQYQQQQQQQYQQQQKQQQQQQQQQYQQQQQQQYQQQQKQQQEQKQQQYQQQQEQQQQQRGPIQSVSIESSASSRSSMSKRNVTLPAVTRSPALRREEPLISRSDHDFFHQQATVLLLPPVTSHIIPNNHLEQSNDQSKLRLLVEQLQKRLVDEQTYLTRLLVCVQQGSIKLEQSHQQILNEYQKTLCQNDSQIHRSVANELNIAIRETQNRIDWLNMVRARALGCLE